LPGYIWTALYANRGEIWHKEHRGSALTPPNLAQMGKGVRQPQISKYGRNRGFLRFFHPARASLYIDHAEIWHARAKQRFALVR